MRLLGFICLACLVPCIGAQSTSKGIDSHFTNAVFKVKMYPGAKVIPGSSQRLGIDPPWGWARGFARMGKGWGRGYRTSDKPAKVGAFFKKQLDKMGTAMPQNNSLMFPMMYKLKNGGNLYVNMFEDPNSVQRFEIYYLLAEKSVAKKLVKG